MRKKIEILEYKSKVIFYFKPHINEMSKDKKDNILMIKYQTGAMLIIGMCGIILLIGLMRSKIEWILNIVMRSILGTIIMYFANAALAAAGISLGVGINAVTVLTSGILGFPGLVALYALGIYKIL